MGLDTTHDCWHGAYSSFNEFRYELGRRIGINLDDYKGYHGNGTKELTSIAHPLMPLFNHSDCDGELSVEECKQIVSGLNGVIEAAVPEDKDSPFSFLRKVVQFRDGCLLAISKNEIVEFH